MALVMPMTLTGFTALSVLRVTSRSTPSSSAAVMTFCVPMTFVITAS